MLFGPKSLPLPKHVQSACATLHSNGYSAYVVGGAVRDFMMGLEPSDWDLATDCPPDGIEHLFAKTLPMGKTFGTVTVIIEDKQIQLTTLRKDGFYSDKRHPDSVEFTSDVEEDLRRRDFTVNAIAFDTKSGKYVDPENGIRDIKKRRLRTVGDPHKRFTEDPLRILRLYRFYGTRGFSPCKNAVKAIEPQLLATVSWERIQQEWTKLILGENLVKAMELMHTTGVLHQIIPELANCHQVYQGSQHKWDVLGHSIMACQSIAPKLHLRLGALFHDIGKPDTKEENGTRVTFHGHDKLGAEMVKGILRRFRYSSDLTEKVSHLVRHHMFPIHPYASDKAIRRFILKVGHDAALDLLELRRADIAAMRFPPRQAVEFGQAMSRRLKQVFDQGSVFTISDLAVNGTTLINQFNLPSGPIIGRLLNHLFNQVVDNPELNNTKTLLHLAKEWLKENNE